MSSIYKPKNGEGGIRTPDEPKPIIDFESTAFNHSATSPGVYSVKLPKGLFILHRGAHSRPRLLDFDERAKWLQCHIDHRLLLRTKLKYFRLLSDYLAAD